MRFLHCKQCGDTTRLPFDEPTDDGAAAFYAAHASCFVETYASTGHSAASGPWHDPMSTRRHEVLGRGGPATAIGTRRILDEPLSWRIEPEGPEESTWVELDRPLFWATVDRVLYPSHLPKRPLEDWATQIDHFARAARPAEIVLLDDDPGSGNTTFACFTMTARARLESALAGIGFDEITRDRLSSLFDEEIFPPLRIRRCLRVRSEQAPSAQPDAPSLTR